MTLLQVPFRSAPTNATSQPCRLSAQVWLYKCRREPQYVRYMCRFQSQTYPGSLVPLLWVRWLCPFNWHQTYSSCLISDIWLKGRSETCHVFKERPGICQISAKENAFHRTPEAANKLSHCNTSFYQSTHPESWNEGTQTGIWLVVALSFNSQYLNIQFAAISQLSFMGWWNLAHSDVIQLMLGTPKALAMTAAGVPGMPSLLRVYSNLPVCQRRSVSVLSGMSNPQASVQWPLKQL